MRIHRSLKRLIGSVDPTKVANAAEDYIDCLRLYKKEIEGIPHLAGKERLKSAIKQIDKLEREILKMEERAERLRERRKEKAAVLKELLWNNLDILGDYLEPEEMRDFPSV